MARGKRLTLEERITAAEQEVVKYKSKYEQALGELRKLLEKKKALETAEIVKAIEKSDRTYDEIIAFLNRKNED